MTNDPLTLGLLEAALAIATLLYALLVRRRHSENLGVESRMNTIAHNYGRSGLP